MILVRIVDSLTLSKNVPLISQKDTMSIESTLPVGNVPSDEPEAQVGKDNYSEVIRFQIRLYRQQLTEKLLNEFRGKLRVKFLTVNHPHDFGKYYDTVVVYTVGDPISVAQAQLCEAGMSEWTPERKVMMENFLNAKPGRKHTLL
jgi:hypothetical protein